MRWEWLPFAELGMDRLYAVLCAREQVFVLEQRCLYLDADGADPRCWHLLGSADDGTLAAYLRVPLPGVKYAEHSMGRVLTTAAHRGGGLGRELVREGLARIEATFGVVPVRLAAQAHLEAFYESFGFARVGDVYDDDGIPHLEMLRPATPVR